MDSARADTLAMTIFMNMLRDNPEFAKQLFLEGADQYDVGTMLETLSHEISTGISNIDIRPLLTHHTDNNR